MRELRRQVLHMLVGTVIIILFLNNWITLLAFFILVCLGIFLSFVGKQVKLPIMSWFIGFFEREQDKHKFPGRGIIFFGAGCILVLRLFTRDIALASIIILTFADSISHLVGSNFGKIPNPLNNKKKVEGSIAGFLVGVLVAIFFVSPLLAIIGSFAAMLFEAVRFEVSGERIDDNLLVPLIAGTFMYLALVYL